MIDDDLFEDLLHGGAEPASHLRCREALTSDTYWRLVRAQVRERVRAGEPVRLTPEPIKSWIKDSHKMIHHQGFKILPLWSFERAILSLCDVIDSVLPLFRAAFKMKVDLGEILDTARQFIRRGGEYRPEEITIPVGKARHAITVTVSSSTFVGSPHEYRVKAAREVVRACDSLARKVAYRV